MWFSLQRSDMSIEGLSAPGASQPYETHTVLVTPAGGFETYP